MVKYILINKTLAFGIMFLFVISTVSPMVNGTECKNQRIIKTIFEDISFWNPIEVVSTESNEDSARPFLTVDEEGDVHTVWEDNTNFEECRNDSDIFYKKKLANGKWSDTEVVSTESTGISTTPSVTVDSNGNIHVAWYDETDYSGSGNNLDIFYKMKTENGDWTTTEVVSIDSNNSGVLYDSPPAIITDQSGNLHIAWRDTFIVEEDYFFNIFYRLKPKEGLWSETVLITSATNYCSRPTLAVDSYGDLHIVWRDPYIYYKFKPNGGAWSDTEIIPIETECGLYPSLTVDGFDTLHLVWDYFSDFGGSGDDDDVFYIYKPYNGEWSDTELVSTESDYHSRFPNIAVDIEGTVHVAWFDFSDYLFSGNDGDVFYKMKTKDGDWTITEVVSKDCESPSLIGGIAVDLNGLIHVVWSDSTNISGAGADQDVFYRLKGLPKGYTPAFLFGIISNVQHNGSFFTFNAKFLIWLSFKPVIFKVFSSEENITGYGQGIGFFGRHIIIGRYNVKY